MSDEAAKAHTTRMSLEQERAVRQAQERMSVQRGKPVSWSEAIAECAFLGAKVVNDGIATVTVRE